MVPRTIAALTLLFWLSCPVSAERQRAATEPTDLDLCMDFTALSRNSRENIGIITGYFSPIFRSVAQVEGGSTLEGCDVKYVYSPAGDNMFYSAYSRRALFGVSWKSGRSRNQAVIDEVAEKFAQDGALYQRLIGERDAAHKPAAAAGGVTKEELRQMMSEVTARKEPADSAPPELHSDVDAPKYKDAEQPQNFAVIVGVEKYVDLPAAQFAERDAAAVHAHLLALGYP